MGVRGRLIALLAASLATSAGAGQIGYRINGGSTPTKTIANPGDPVEIDLLADLGTTDPIATDTDVHIFDILTDAKPSV